MIIASAMTGRLRHWAVMVLILSVGCLVPVAWLLIGLRRATREALEAAA